MFKAEGLMEQKNGLFALQEVSLCPLAPWMMLSYDAVGKAEPYCEGTYLFAMNLVLYNKDNKMLLKHCSVGINTTKIFIF